jgi:enoyl-CoA hydratase/carnithine racemase
MPGPELIVSAPEPGIAVFTFNRPDARNALSISLLATLQNAIDDAGADSTISAIVIAANGPVFCSGHDLKELTAHRGDADGGRSFYGDVMNACSRLMQSIVACPKPVIAAVQGTATAAGCQLVASCDIAIAAETAEFATPGVNIGLFCSTPMVALTRNVPTKKAMEMLLLGEAMGAREAERMGLINRVVRKDAAVAEALSVARKIAAKSRSTIALGKAAFYRQRELPLDEAYRYTSGVMVDNMLQADAEEGICAFLEKRAPRWQS